MTELTKKILKECFYNQKRLTRELLIEKFPDNLNEINGVINNFFQKRNNTLFLFRDYILTSVDFFSNGLGFIYKRKFYKTYNFLPKDIILYNLKTKRIIELISRKYDVVSIYSKSNKIIPLAKDLVDYNFIIKANILEKHLYKMQIKEVFNNNIVLDYLQDLGEFSSEDIHIKDLLSKHNLYNIYDKDYSLKILDSSIYTQNFDTYFITIDQDGAKDLDDAIGLREDNQYYYLYISIADVSSFINLNDELFTEARKRMFSIYYLNKVVPMLPSVLSSDKCSLLNNGYKYVISNIFTISKNNYEIINHQVKKEKIIIKDNFYFSKMLDNKIVLKIKNISDNIRKRYLSFLDFNNPEIKFFYDDNILKYQLNKESTGSKLVETLMILTNLYMAKYYQKNKISAIYRICPPPNIDKIKYFNKVMKQNNLDLLDISNLYTSYKSVISKNIDNLFYQDQLIKTQEKAIYSVKNALHYPLNLLDYLHFTAPIRRFVDLINHYQLSQYLEKKNILNEAILTSYCEEINQKEKEVNKFTSQLNKLLAIIYYSTNKQLVNGYVTGFFGSRMDILLENNLYVSIPLSSMDNYYIISEDRLMCYNLKDNKKYKIGDKLKVKPYLLDIENLVIDFKIVNGDNQE